MEGYPGLDAISECWMSIAQVVSMSFTYVAHAIFQAERPLVIMDGPAHFTCSLCQQSQWLPRWEENVSVKAINFIDEANNLEHMYPIFESDTYEGLLQQYRHWTQTNLARRFSEHLKRMELSCCSGAWFVSHYDRHFLLDTSGLRKTGVLKSLPRCSMSRVRSVRSVFQRE